MSNDKQSMRILVPDKVSEAIRDVNQKLRDERRRPNFETSRTKAKEKEKQIIDGISGKLSEVMQGVINGVDDSLINQLSSICKEAEKAGLDPSEKHLKMGLQMVEIFQYYRYHMSRS